MSTKFKIENVKWEWAKTVKNPSVYRNDEFIKSDSKEEALEAIIYLLNKPQGLTYAITVKRDKEYFTYYRHSMPCLGGLVKYKDSHGPKHFYNPYFPRDIYVAFPEGKVTYIGIYSQGIKQKLDSPYYQFVFSKESPWVAAFGDKKTIVFDNNCFVLTNMKTDPTVFYSLMRLAGLVYGSSKKDWNPKAEILIGKNTMADPRRLAGQKPIITSGGNWADDEGWGYTRCFNESIFKTILPVKLKDFGQFVGGYPQAPFTNTYFISEMKKKFKVDLTSSNIHNTDQKTHDIVVESWDYFKEESKKLGDGFPE